MTPDDLNQKVEQARSAYADARALMDQGSYEEALPKLDAVLNLGMEVTALASGGHSYRFFHIASHGLLDAEKPQFSGLVFTPDAAGGDPFWRTFEIFNARIPSELAVLSACETGLGKLVSGEGIFGLTRAFLYAGAPAVCVSLWKVADKSSPHLMSAFYEVILAGQSPAGALRAAQQKLDGQRRFAHPYWWAPFVVVGKGRA